MDGAQLQAADYLVMGGYFLLMVAVGIYFRRFMRRARDYFTGDTQVPWWLAGVSYYMTTFSTFAFVAYGEVAYLYGWVSITLVWVAVPACLFAAFVMAPRWRRARVETPVEFLETRFSTGYRQLFAWSGFPLRIADNGLRLYALGVFVSVAVGIDIFWAIVVSGIVLLAYTFLGGLWAVAVTDFVQGIVLLVALLIIFPLALMRSDGGRLLLEHAPDPGYLSLFNPPYTWVYVLGFFVLILLNYNAGWALVQRFYSVRDDREARKVGLLAAALNVVGPPLFFLPVMLARDAIPALENTRYAYVAMAIELLPVGLMGIMMTAMFSATMSSLSSEYNVLASVATRDIYARLFRPDADDRELLRVGRIFTAAVGLFIMGIAILVTMYPDTPLFSIMVTVFGVAVAPMMLPLLGGLLFPRLGHRAAVAGFVVGVVTGFTTLAVQKYYLPTLPGMSDEWITFEAGAYAIFVNVGVTALTMLIWSLVDRIGRAERARIDAFFERLRAPLVPAVERSVEAAPAPFFITGIIVGVTGLLLIGASFMTATPAGRWIDIASGLALCVIGWVLYSRTRERAYASPSTE